MKDQQFLRKGKRMIDVGNAAPPLNKTFDSINQAKKESRKLQMQLDGALGLGSVGVVK